MEALATWRRLLCTLQSYDLQIIMSEMFLKLNDIMFFIKYEHCQWM